MNERSRAPPTVADVPACGRSPSSPGVAMSSVSRVLSGHPDVSPAMQKRVLAAVAELGVRARPARAEPAAPGDDDDRVRRRRHLEPALRGDRRRRGDAAARGRILDAARRTRRRAPELDAAHIALLAQRRVDGIILSVSDEQNPATLAALERLDIPVVMLDRDVDVGHAVHVNTDHQLGMRQAVAHLLDLGHRNIAMINGQPMRPVKERRAALEACYAERGLPETYRFVDGDVLGRLRRARGGRAAVARRIRRRRSSPAGTS